MYDYLFSDFGVHKRMLQSQPFSTGSCSESCRCYHHNQSLDRDGRWGYTNGCFTHNLSQLGRVQSRVAVIITINPWVVTVVGGTQTDASVTTFLNWVVFRVVSLLSSQSIPGS